MSRDPEAHPPLPAGAVRRLVESARAAADAAAEVQIRWAGRLGMGEVAEKGASDFVTRADLEAQAAALAVLRERHPGHRVLAEEEEDGDQGGASSSDASEAARRDDDTPIWVVDPLDGTTNFVHGHPMYAASVAVAVRGRPVAGAVSCPSTGERWWAARGRGAWKNGRRIRVSPMETLREALVGTGFPFKALDVLPEYLDQLGRLLERSAGVRRGGAAALDLAYLAEGRLDAFWELFLNPWDFAAGALLVEEAGGLVGRVGGGPLELTPGSVLAANGPELLEAVGEVVGE